MYAAEGSSEDQCAFTYLMNQINKELNDAMTSAIATASMGSGEMQNSYREKAMRQVSLAMAYMKLTETYGFQDSPPEKSQNDLEQEAKTLSEQLYASEKFQTTMNYIDPKELRSFVGKQDEKGTWKPLDAVSLVKNYQATSKEATQHAKWLEQGTDRVPRARNLVTQLERSTQKSILGKIKSIFVGNSQQYKAAFKAMQDLADGKVQTQEEREAAKNAIEDYVMNRGDKVRDHQYGRDRFDAMMKGLGEVMEPEEFLETVNSINRLREERYHDREHAINGEDYLPDGPSKEAFQKVKAAQDKAVEKAAQKDAAYLNEMKEQAYTDAKRAEPDQERIMKDAATMEADAQKLAQWKKNPSAAPKPKSMMEREQEYLDILRKVDPKQLQERLGSKDPVLQAKGQNLVGKIDSHLRSHPAFRILAEPIIEERGLGELLTVPENHKVLGGESAEVLDQQIKHLWDLDVQKHPELKDKEPPTLESVKEEKPPEVEKPQGPQVGGM